jgi:hypothetical protein
MPDSKPTPATVKPAPAPVLARASEATDPAVHKLLADRQSAYMNEDKEAEAAATKALAELGYE